MRILIIRHGDPCYNPDTLTEKGNREAALLADFLSKEKIDAIYSSPLGRAYETCLYTANRLNITPVVKPWLREFDYPVYMNGEKRLAWDFLPEYLEEHPELYDRKQWLTSEIMQTGEIAKRYQEATQGLDDILRNHGYERNGRFYRVLHENRDTIAFFCHFGAECILLSHLCNMSPSVLMHHFVALPTSVTTLYSEERREGKALFRCTSFGSTTHLYVGNEPPSFAARFCETYHSDERHD